MPIDRRLEVVNAVWEADMEAAPEFPEIMTVKDPHSVLVEGTPLRVVGTQIIFMSVLFNRKCRSYPFFLANS